MRISLKIVSLLFLVVMAFGAEISSAQVGFRRDFWFAVPLNNDANDVSAKVFTVFIQAHSTGTANVQVGSQNVLTKELAEGELWSLQLPKSVEMASSSVVDAERAIHVWGQNTDLAVYFLSRDPFTSDGFEVIPSSYWGTRYVVASYAALNVSPSFDLPSECCIVANEDNTEVTITPTRNIRANGNPAQVQYPKNVPFTITLQKGTCIQFQTAQEDGSSDLDLSGTEVNANKPVGVLGASACPFIPSDPYCDHISEMLLPTSRWGRSYHTLPFIGRKYGGDSFLLLAFQANQPVMRNGTVAAVLGKLTPYFVSDIAEPSVWTSSAPFMLVQYINGSTYGVPSGQSRNQGDPAMVQINPDELADTLLYVVIPFIAPAAGQNAFTNYLNIMLPRGFDSVCTFDGVPIGAAGDPFLFADSLSIGYRIKKVTPGAHRFRGPAPATAYAYGYTTDDSYAWPIDLGGNGKELSADVRGEMYIPHLAMSPNPLRKNERLHISLTGSLTESYTVQVTDILGNVCFETSGMEEDLSLWQLGSGIYTVTVVTDGQTYQEKLVIIE